MAATRTQIYLTAEQRERLDALGERDRRSLAALIRDAVDEYLDRTSPDVEAALEGTFGAVPDASSPSREEWAHREERIWRERAAARH